MRNISVAIPRPPVMVLARRPQLSAQMVAGIVTAQMTSAETPEARKLAEFEESPAWWKRIGAYLGRGLVSRV
jgi:hypothetical protein